VAAVFLLAQECSYVPEDAGMKRRISVCADMAKLASCAVRPVGRGRVKLREEVVA
jgi:hypothetical protein